MDFVHLDLFLYSGSSSNQTTMNSLRTWENIVPRSPRDKNFLLFFSCKWLSESDPSTAQSNIQNGTWQLNGSANWVCTLWPSAWGLTAIGNPRSEHYSKYKEREKHIGHKCWREEGRRWEKDEVEEPGIMEPVRMPGLSREALVITCTFGKI